MKKIITICLIALAAITALIVANCTDNAVSNAKDQQADDFARRFTARYTLTVNSNPTAGGTVTVNGTTTNSGGFTTHNHGASVTVVATAASGYRFTGWSGASTSTNREITLTISANRILTANFTQQQTQTCTLTVNRNPTNGGSVTVNSTTYTAPTTHNANAQVTLVATPASGFDFVNWTGDGAPTGAGASNATATITMSANRTITANFQQSIVTDSFTDPRDNQTYRTVVIGGRTWMAENLNYRDSSWSHNDVNGEVAANTLGSWCYNRNSFNCTIYGRLYTWGAAMIACPSDWHLPDTTDWNDLYTAVGGLSVAGRALRSSDWNGDDTFGFSALPGGARNGVGGFQSIGSYGYWWSETEDGNANAYGTYMGGSGERVQPYRGWKHHGSSVRCVKE